jgi:hypothetical protein
MSRRLASPDGRARWPHFGSRLARPEAEVKRRVDSMSPPDGMMRLGKTS